MWSRDGRRLFFRDYDNLLVAAVETAPTFSVVSVNVLFADTFVGRLQPHANYDVSPEGSHFVFLKEADQPEAFVVYNWLTGAAGRAPGVANRLGSFHQSTDSRRGVAHAIASRRS